MSKGRKFWGKTQSLGQAIQRFKEATHFERGQILNLSRRFEWENGSVFENSLSRDVLHFPQQNTINTKRYQERRKK